MLVDGQDRSVYAIRCFALHCSCTIYLMKSMTKFNVILTLDASTANSCQMETWFTEDAV